MAGGAGPRSRDRDLDLEHLRLHVYPVLGERPIGSVRPTEVQGLVRQLYNKPASSTVGVVYGRVVAVFRAAVRDRVVASSPCIDIRLPRALHNGGR